jgi:hypothetical protein
MRELTRAGVPFDIEYYSYQESKGITEGYKIAKGVVLRSGLSKRYSAKADTLIGYRQDKKDRFFNLPLLIKFNNKYINEY